MVTAIVRLTDKKNLPIVRSNMFLCGVYANFLIIVQNEDLYLECRQEFDGGDYGECLIVYDKGNLSEAVRKYVNSEYVLYLDEEMLIMNDGLLTLKDDFRYKSEAGFFSADYLDKECWVKDIYDDLEFCDWRFGRQKASFDEWWEVDLVCPYILMTKTENFVSEMEFLEEKFEGKMDFFGLGLRRKGYKNYIDVSVRATKGVKSSE